MTQLYQEHSSGVNTMPVDVQMEIVLATGNLPIRPLVSAISKQEILVKHLVRLVIG